MTEQTRVTDPGNSGPGIPWGDTEATRDTACESRAFMGGHRCSKEAGHEGYHVVYLPHATIGWGVDPAEHDPAALQRVPDTGDAASDTERGF